MILLIDTERGSISVNGLIKSGEIDRRYANKFHEVDKIAWDVVRGVIKPDMVVIDTLTTLTTTTRLDVVIDPAQLTGGGNLWQHRGKLTAAQRDWGEMSDLINRLLRMLRESGVPSVFVCHEGEREDPVTGMKKEGPDLNQAILRDVYALTDALLRLSFANEQFKDATGTVYPAGTRVLRLAPNANSMAKLRVPDDMPNPSPIIAEPTWEKFVVACGGDMPQNITLYGASGVGKTRFVGSAVAYFKQLRTDKISGQVVSAGKLAEAYKQNLSASSVSGQSGSK